MEGFQWLRIGAIVALILGAVYVLLPTITGEAPADRIASAAGDVQVTATRQKARLSFQLDVIDGEPEAMVAALEERFSAGGVGIRGMEVEGNEITVRLDYVTPTDVGIAVATMSGEGALYEVSAIVPLPPKDAPPSTSGSQALLDAVSSAGVADASYWFAVLGGVDGAKVPADANARWSVVSARSTGVGLSLQLAPAGRPSAPRVLAMDGQAVAGVMPDGTAVPLGESRVQGAKLQALVTGPLPGIVKLVEEHLHTFAADAGGGSAAAADAGRTLPPWLVGILPDTRISLGLDLQGGIDLTLQIELDQAVMGQAGRDSLGLRDAAAKEGVTLDSARRAPTSPVIELVTDDELSTVTTFMAKQLGSDYQYFETDGRTQRFVMRDERQEEVKEQVVVQVLETLRKRVDATGVKEPSIVKKAGGRINIQLPGATDVQSAVSIIGKAAVLEFRMVDEEFEDRLLEQILDAAEAELPKDRFYDDAILNAYLWDTKRLPPGNIIVWTEPGNEKEWQSNRTWPRVETVDGVPLDSSPYALMNEVPLTGNDVNDARVSFEQQTGFARVQLEFKPRGGTIFCDLTAESVGKRFAIILDNIVQSAPSIRERICGGAASIEMSSALDPLKESQELATVLRTGALDAPVVVASVRQVGASLGADSIRQGSIGALVGSAFVLVFMALWYRAAGLIADFALVINVLMVLAALAATGATLTLPGIAGIALTVGMAVDANIIIYERIREELRLGVPPRKAVDVGFEKAVVAVLDANITTAIAGIVLFSYGSGPIKGFAVTLLIGIVTTLVSALFITRTVMELVTRSSAARLRI